MANNRVAYGLCKKYNIELPSDATPKEAWEALKKNGISEEQAYEEVSKTEKQGTTYEDILKNDSSYTNGEKGIISHLAEITFGYGDDDDYSKWKENSPNDTINKLREAGYEPVLKNGQIQNFKFTKEKLAELKKAKEEESNKFHSILNKDELTQEDYEFLRLGDPIPRNEALTGFAQKQYDLSKRFAKEEANQYNFFENSVGVWDKATVPKREPDYQSINSRTGQISSEYWYTKDGVYRRSNHWGSGVASCDWYIEGQKRATKTQFDRTFDVGDTQEAFIKWSDLYPKGQIKTNPKTNEYEPRGYVFDKDWEWKENY